MDITGMMAVGQIVPVSQTDKEEALRSLAYTLGDRPEVRDGRKLADAILARESILSTGIGQEFAVPHAKIDSVETFRIAIGVCAKGIEFDSLDRLPVRVIAMIAAPEAEQNTYLKVLKKVTDVMKVRANRDAIVEAIGSGEPQKVIDLFKD